MVEERVGDMLDVGSLIWWPTVTTSACTIKATHTHTHTHLAVVELLCQIQVPSIRALASGLKSKSNHEYHDK